jgi:hypothetical protein
MLKNILNLEGAQQLSKKEQNVINGGDGLCIDECGPNHPHECNENQKCLNQSCDGVNSAWYCVYKDGPMDP